MTFINDLETELRKNSNGELAIKMANYMKNKFSFLGIQAINRRTILKTNWHKQKEEVQSNFRSICWELFNKK